MVKKIVLNVINPVGSSTIIPNYKEQKRKLKGHLIKIFLYTPLLDVNTRGSKVKRRMLKKIYAFFVDNLLALVVFMKQSLFSWMIA